MFLEFFNNNGIRYMRITESYRGYNSKHVKTARKRIIKNIGPLSRYDDGEPDIENRLREKFRKQELVIDGFEYDTAECLDEKKEEEKEEILIKLQKKSYPTLKVQNVGYFFLDTIFEALGIGDVLRKYKSDSKIEYDLLGLIKLFTYKRVLDPDSKRATILSQKDKPLLFFPQQTNDKNCWYRCLTVLNQLDDKIQTRMNTRIGNSVIGRPLDTMYYDVTNCYFEIPYPDEPTFLLDEKGVPVSDETGNPIIVDPGFRKKSKSKEERHLPLVQIGLLMDVNAIPVCIHTYAGNKPDSLTFENVLENNLATIPAEKTIFVTDNAMYSTHIFYLLVSGGNGYIVSKSVRVGWGNLRDWAMDTEGWNNNYTETELNDTIVSMIEEKDTDNDSKFKDQRETDSSLKPTFRYKSRLLDRSAESRDGKKIKYKVRQAVYWSYSHYKKDMHELDELKENLRLAELNPNSLKSKDNRLREYLKQDIFDSKTGEMIENPKVVIQILQEKLQEKEEQCGLFTLETTETELNELVILGKYRGLSRIENSFRVCKSDLNLRPVYVSEEQHIKAHVLICFMALTIERIIQNMVMSYLDISTRATTKWTFGISSERLKKALTDYNVAEIQDPYYMMNDLSDDQTLLNSVFGVKKSDFPTINNLKEMKSTLKKNGICNVSKQSAL